MLSDDEWSKLINKLRQLTEAEKITWDLTEGLNDLSVQLGEIGYAIESQDRDGVPPFVLSISNLKNGRTELLDSLTSKGGPERDTHPDTKVIPLWDIAKRMAEGGPQLARNLMDQLSAIDPDAPPTYGQPF